MEKINITKKQKKILTLVVIVGATFLVFIVFIYLPLNQHLVELKKEYYGIEHEIREVKKLVGDKGSLEDGIALLKERLDLLDKKFPAKEEIVLREVPSLAKNIGIEVVSFRPQIKRVIQDLGGSTVNIRDCYVEELSMSMSVKGPYKKVGEFLRILSKDFPVFIKVENLRAAKESKKEGVLADMDLDLKAYLICANEARG